MESVGRFCFYNSGGICNFIRNERTECNICPNFISFKREALSFSHGSSLPVTFFDLGLNTNSDKQYQTSLV
jgi:hypothetical protein